MTPQAPSSRARQPNRTRPRGRRSRTGGAHSPAERRAGARGVLPARPAAGRGRRQPPASRLSVQANAGTRGPAHRARRTPSARSGIPAGLARGRQQADHRRADHAARDRTRDRPWRGAVAAGDAPRAPRRIDRLDRPERHPQARDGLAHPCRPRRSPRDGLPRWAHGENLSSGRGQALDADADRPVLRRGDGADGSRRSRRTVRAGAQRTLQRVAGIRRRSRARSGYTDATISEERWAPPNRMAASASPPRASTGWPPVSARGRQ